MCTSNYWFLVYYNYVMEAISAAELKSIFNVVITCQSDPGTIAKLEICREYFTNPEFKAKLEQFTFDQNKGGVNG